MAWLIHHLQNSDLSLLCTHFSTKEKLWLQNVCNDDRDLTAHPDTRFAKKVKIIRWIVQDLNSTVITLHIPFSQTMIDKFSKFIIMVESWIMKQLRKNVEKNKRMPPEENVFTTTVAHKLDLFIFSPNKSLMKLDGVRSISSHEDITWVFWHLTPLHATSVFVWFECLRNPCFNFFLAGFL